MTTTLDLSQFLYCRNCGMKTHHYRDLKYDWGYSCRICQTWQHQSQLISIQQGYAAREILEGIKDGEIRCIDGVLEDFIEASLALNLDYDYQKADDGWDFTAWSLEDEEKVARIKL
jgi:hypothetical protein